jgi:hypothetical protein
MIINSVASVFRKSVTKMPLTAREISLSTVDMDSRVVQKTF